jgi:transcriptional regulator with XRE-family HTH domain
MSMNNVTEYLRYLRKRKQYSQTVLAEAMGISLRQVSRWEKGGTDSVHAETLFRALDFLGASYDLVQHLLKADELPVEDIELLADEQLRKERTRRSTTPIETPSEGEQFFLALLQNLWQNLTEDVRTLSQHILTSRHAHVYQGQRDFHGASVTCVVLVNEQPLNAVRDWGEPLSIEWGFFGSGPSSLAHALLLHEYGWQTARDFGDAFHYDIIGNLPRELGGIEWTLTSDQINRWLTIRKLVQTALTEIKQEPRT